MKVNKWKLAKCIGIPLIVGLISGLISRSGMEQFQTVKQPPLSPPGWLFPVVWTILYVLMGIASYLVFVKEDDSEISKPFLVYGLQLAVNFFWSIIFFNFQNYLFAFVWLVLLWFLILWTMVLFSKASKTAVILLIPYLFWVSFAGYLNLGVFLLNR